MNLEHYLTFAEMRGKLGMVIPIWFPEDISETDIVRMINLTLADAECLVEQSHQILICDGQQDVKQIIDDMLRASGKSSVVLATEQNRGKGGAVGYGINYLLDNSEVDYIVTRDADGDHFINDVPHLVRLASQMQAELNDSKIAVVGGRLDVHRPMGFARGEYELLVNDVIWHALQYTLAIEEKVINMQYFAEHGLIPDFHSGFKLYTRDSAKIALDGLINAAQEKPELDMLRHGAETVPIVEIVVAGGTLGQVNRITLETQPVVTSEGLNRAIRYANRLIWMFTRLSIPFTSAIQLLDNAIPRTLLYKDSHYIEELMQMRKHLLVALGGKGDEPLYVHSFS
ncbi:TPA: glycosyltransferase [Candidatus Poribacteria bacterium]|nr:glycosyltransferase [Candidatus Poribacteria bacterium]